MRGQSLKHLVESNGIRWVSQRLTEGLELGRRGDPDGLKSSDFSIRELAEAFCGEQWTKRLNPAYMGRVRGVPLLEAGEAVDVTAFSNITGQILFNRIREGWEQAALIGDGLVEFIDTTFDGEKLPWLGRILGEGEDIHPGLPYPETSFGEQYIETPSTIKRGEILSVTKETIFFDRTGQMMKIAGQVGDRVRTRRDKLILDTIIGQTNTFKWKGTTYNTYQAAGTFWSNVAVDNELVDWTSIEKAELLFAKMTDPDTNNPIQVVPNTILVPPAKKHTARRVISATEIRSNNLAPAPNQTTISTNPLDNYTIISSPWLYFRLTNSGLSTDVANKTWFMGDFKRAFLYMRNWDLTTVQAPANSTAEFERDVVLRYKASERGIPGVQDPRYVVKCTG